MSWRTGGYSAGTLEMLNSNMVIVAYTESNDKDFIFDEHRISNKNWRSFFYVHKDIICSGKNYPYRNDDLSKKVIEILQELAKKNLNWTYQYGIQKYKDLISFHSNNYLRNSYDIRGWKGRNHHSIIIYTNGMYNDLIEDNSYNYWCVRNWVKKNTFLNASGKAYCLCCGEPLDEVRRYSGWDDDDFRSHGSLKYCSKCGRSACDTCKTVYSKDSSEKLYRITQPVFDGRIFRSVRGKVIFNDGPRCITVCEHCIDDYYYDTKNHWFISKKSVKEYMESKNVYDNTLEDERKRCRSGAYSYYRGFEYENDLIPYPYTMDDLIPAILKAKVKVG
jgi:hypothetical protein